MCEELKLPRHLQDQLGRASSSIALNIAEGSGKRTLRDRRRFYQIAYGSLKEVKAILELSKLEGTEVYKKADRVGGLVYGLCYKLRS